MRSTIFLAELRESVMRIICSISILVALETFSFIANSLASEVIILPARALKDNT